MAMYAPANVGEGVQAAFDSEPGILNEHKGLSFAVHYRPLPDADQARLTIVDTLQRLLQRGVEILGRRR